MKLVKVAALAVVAGALGAAPPWAHAEYPSVEQQMKLDEGMTMEQVRALLGEPDSIDSSTCFHDGAVRNCRTWTYGNGRNFRVRLAKYDKGWVVIGWSS